MAAIDIESCHYFQRHRSMFEFLTQVNGAHLGNATINYVTYRLIGKMLLMLLLNSVQSLKVLTFCVQLMCLATLLKQRNKPTKERFIDRKDSTYLLHRSSGLCLDFALVLETHLVSVKLQLPACLFPLVLYLL